ncbi:MAG: flagellar protein FliT [Fimbriimonadaceae bacterium]
MQPNPEALAQQLYLVSLALERALLAEDWVEVDALFNGRATLIERLQDLRPVGRARTIIDMVQNHEKGLFSCLSAIRSSIGQEMGAMDRARTAERAYQSASALA